MSEATGLWDAESILFNRGRSVASWIFTGSVFLVASYRDRTTIEVVLECQRTTHGTCL